ncbi:16774_t:CDS:2, partial [Funneliformis geosporum]
MGDGKRSLRRSLTSVKFGTLLKVFADKASIAGRQLVLVDPKNTTQRCSDCQKLAIPKLELKDRIFKSERVRQEPSLEFDGEKLTVPPTKRGKYLNQEIKEKIKFDSPPHCLEEIEEDEELCHSYDCNKHYDK